MIENSGATLVLSAISARDSSFGAYPDKNLTIRSGTCQRPTFWAERFTDPVTGLMSFTLDRYTSVQVAAVIQTQIQKGV